MNNPQRGSVAVCSKGALGLITKSWPIEVAYPDGAKRQAYVGFHLTSKIAEVGSPWGSSDPHVVGAVPEVVLKFIEFALTTPKYCGSAVFILCAIADQFNEDQR